MIVLREPVARAISFFEYQKIRLRFPGELTIEQYLAAADALADADFDDAGNEKYMAVRGGRYADWLPEWWAVLGPDAVKIVYFEDLIADGAAVLADVAGFLALDPAGLPDELRSENRTTAFKAARLQRVALAVNDGSERLLRRMPAVKRSLRSWYFKLNGRPDVRPRSPTRCAQSWRRGSWSPTRDWGRCSTGPACGVRAGRSDRLRSRSRGPGPRARRDRRRRPDARRGARGMRFRVRRQTTK